MQCPTDGVVLHREILQDVEVDVCSKCHGVWLEQTEVRALTRHFSIPEYSDVDELLAKWKRIEHDGTPPKDFWSEEKRICPKDGTEMKKHYFAGSSIGVDQCQVCNGFWLDGGELHAVAAYIDPNPALDAAWSSFIQDQNEWNRKMGKLERLDEPPEVGKSFSTILWQLNPYLGMGTMMLMYILDYLHLDHDPI